MSELGKPRIAAQLPKDPLPVGSRRFRSLKPPDRCYDPAPTCRLPSRAALLIMRNTPAYQEALAR